MSTENNLENQVPAVRLRRATPADAEWVQVLFADHLRSLGAQPDAELDADIADFAGHYFRAGAYFCVAETHNGILVGMGGIAQGLIGRLYVRPDFRGRHLARAIVQHLVRRHPWSSGCKPYSVVARANAPAQKVFRDCGFVATGRPPEHPQMQHCEILELPQPPVLLADLST